MYVIDAIQDPPTQKKGEANRESVHGGGSKDTMIVPDEAHVIRHVSIGVNASACDRPFSQRAMAELAVKIGCCAVRICTAL